MRLARRLLEGRAGERSVSFDEILCALPKDLVNLATEGLAYAYISGSVVEIESQQD